MLMQWLYNMGKPLNKPLEMSHQAPKRAWISVYVCGGEIWLQLLGSLYWGCIPSLEYNEPSS